MCASHGMPGSATLSPGAAPTSLQCELAVQQLRPAAILECQVSLSTQGRPLAALTACCFATADGHCIVGPNDQHTARTPCLLQVAASQKRPCCLGNRLGCPLPAQRLLALEGAGRSRPVCSSCLSPCWSPYWPRQMWPQSARQPAPAAPCTQ